ncbi:hypothetical protein D3C87_1276460 [compost metagenome]
MRRVRPLAGDQTLLGEEGENAFSIRASFGATGIGLTAQLNGRCQTRQWNLRIRELPRQTQPWQRTSLIERAAAGIFREQSDLHIQVRGQ